MQTDNSEPRGSDPEELNTKDRADMQSAPAAAVGAVSADAVSADTNINTAMMTGRRQSVSNIARQLTNQDLTQLGSVKLIIENLDRAEGECESLRTYVDRFHEADKQRGILEEKLRTNKAIEVGFAFGVGVGCAMIGLVPSFWDTGKFAGPMMLGVGIVLVSGAAAMRIIKQ